MHVLSIFIVSTVVTTYCFIVFGEALVVVLLACRSSSCCASHLSVPCHFVYCFSGLVLWVSLGVVCSLEPSVGFVSDYSFEYGVWLDCQFVIYFVVHFCFPVYLVFLYYVHHLAFVSYVCNTFMMFSILSIECCFSRRCWANLDL
jgi:hypothetical protein